MVDNIGSVSNRGIEVLLTTQNVATSNFSWSSTLNFNYNKNRIEKLGENNEDIESGPFWVSGSQTILRVGEPLSFFWGYRRLGTWNTDEAAEVGRIPGEAKRTTEKEIIGSGLPDWTGSFINDFTFGHFDLTVNLQFVLGVDIMQQYYHSVEDRSGIASGLRTILTEAWTPENQNTMVQQIRHQAWAGQNSEVYALIVGNLEFAVNSAGLSDANMIENNYRVSRPAAAALLADVQLTRGGFPQQNDNYAAAADAARVVIEGGSHALAQHDLIGGEVDPENSAYNKIRQQQSEAIAGEFVYPIEFTIGIAGSGYPAYTYPVTLTNQTNYSITNQAYEPRDEFLAMYDDEEDLRIQNKQLWHNTYTNENGETTTFRFQPYLWHDDQALFGTTNPANYELEVAAEAVDYLTQVRSRAYYMQDAEDIRSSLAGLSVQDFVEEVWAERNRELALNFKIWFDMVRTRKYPQASDGEITFVDLIGQESTWGSTFMEKFLLLPLPGQELQRNAELIQNPDY